MNKKDRQHVWKNYFSMLKQSGLPWGLMVCCFLLSMAVAVLSLALATQISVAIKDVSDIKTAVPELIKLVGILAAGIVASVLGKHLQGIVTAQVDRNVQRYAVHKVLKLKTKDLEETDTKQFITRLTEDTAKNSPFLIEMAINEIPRIYYIIAAIIAVKQIDQPALVGAMFLLIPGVLILAYVSGLITFKNRNKVQTRLAAVTAKLAEKIDSIELIKSYGTEEKEIEAGNETLDELKAVRKEAVLVDHINKFISNMIWFIDVTIIVVPPTILMLNGKIDRTIYAAYTVIMARFEGYVKQHLGVWVALKEAQGATLRLSSILNLDTEDDEDKTVSELKGDIRFDHVSFAYGDKAVLSDVSFTIEEGKKTGIAGLSGSGKSTVFALIERFYDPQKGTIFIGDRDTKDLGYGSLRKQFAYLPQNAPAMSGSIRDMLSYSSEKKYSDDELIGALKDVMLLEDVQALGGLDYDIGKGGENLSGGQKQKLGLARMLLSDCSYILLDEATSALDPEATASIQKLIDERCKGKTLIVIAHDLSTIANSDKILVFDQGKLAGEGTHEELCEKLPLYRDLVKGV